MVGMKLPTLALPLQGIETIDEPREINFFESTISRGEPSRVVGKKAASRTAGFVRSRRVQRQSPPRRFPSRQSGLIWGDNKLAMASLLERFRGKIDL
jgi:hypothetical protein